MATEKQATERQIEAGDRFGINLRGFTLMGAMRALEPRFEALRQKEWADLIAKLEVGGIVEGARIKCLGRIGTIRYFDHNRRKVMVAWEELTANGRKKVSDSAHPRHFELA